MQQPKKKKKTFTTITQEPHWTEKIAFDQLNRCILSFFTIQLRSTSDPIKIVTVIQKY